MLQTGQSNIITDNWHHVAFSFDSSNSNLKLFVDGILKNSSNVSILTSSIQLSNIILGSNIDASIDNVKIFNTALDTEQIKYLASSANYNNSLQNNIVDLHFNDNYHTPVFDHVGVTTVGNLGYSNGFIQGSKAIDFNNGYIRVNDVDGFPTDELSFSAWVNLTDLNSTQHIAVSDGFDMSLNTSNISLKLGNTAVVFTTTNVNAPFFTGERLKIDFNSGVNDTSYDAKTNNVGVVSTGVAGGSFSNDILSYPNASFYADKITLSSWVKTSTGGTIFNINDNLNVNIGNNRVDVNVGVSAQSKVLVSRLNSTHYTVINKITSFDGEPLGSLIQSSGNVEFNIVFDSLKKLSVSEISFNVPFRNHSPTNISVRGINGTNPSVELINEDIAFRNKQYTYKFYNTSDVPFNTIKVKVEGGVKLRIKDIQLSGYLYSYVAFYAGQDDYSAVYSGNNLLSFDTYNKFTINLNAGVSVSAILYNITANTLTNIGSVSNGFTITITDVGEYFVRVTDSNGIVYNSNKVNVTSVLPQPPITEIPAFPLNSSVVYTSLPYTNTIYQNIYPGGRYAITHNNKIYEVSVQSEEHGGEASTHCRGWWMFRQLTNDENDPINGHLQALYCTGNHIHLPHWMKIKLPRALVAKSGTIRESRNTHIQNWNLRGSNDDVNWTTLYSGNGIGHESTKNFSFNNDTSFLWYMIEVVSLNYSYDGDNKYFRINNWNLQFYNVTS